MITFNEFYDKYYGGSVHHQFDPQNKYDQLIKKVWDFGITKERADFILTTFPDRDGFSFAELIESRIAHEFYGIPTKAQSNATYQKAYRFMLKLKDTSDKTLVECRKLEVEDLLKLQEEYSHWPEELKNKEKRYLTKWKLRGVERALNEKLGYPSESNPQQPTGFLSAAEIIKSFEE